MKLVLTDAFVSIGARNVSNWVRSVSLVLTADLPEATGMGDGAKVKLAGLKDWSAQITFNQDFGYERIDWLLFDFLKNGTKKQLVLRPTQSIASYENPDIYGDCVLASYPIVAGEVGSALETQISLFAAGDLFSTESLLMTVAKLPLDQNSYPIDALCPYIAHKIDVSSSASARNSTAFQSTTRAIEVMSSVDCFIKFGKTAVAATTSDHYLPAGVTKVFSLGHSDISISSVAGPFTHLAGITASGSGSVYVSELA